MSPNAILYKISNSCWDCLVFDVNVAAYLIFFVLTVYLMCIFFNLAVYLFIFYPVNFMCIYLIVSMCLSVYLFTCLFDVHSFNCGCSSVYLFTCLFDVHSFNCGCLSSGLYKLVSGEKIGWDLLRKLFATKVISLSVLPKTTFRRQLLSQHFHKLPAENT